ncbi:nucleoside hydrolase [Desulforhopalus vacuolatus]|uniref:nucleoside hydrolase n=1 Tax=Desulforhopalus vacuolatus TaxID=40414 RepID=UPI0034DE0A69
MSGHIAAAAEKGAIKQVVIDTDMGWDDILSILYLMKNPNINIIGITVTGCGETNLRWGTIIAKTLMELGGKTQVPVAVGTSTPLKFDHVFPQAFKSDMNDIMGLLGSLNPDKTMNIDTRPAWKFLADSIDQSEDKITILSLGGFTNLARMLELYPATHIDNIENVYAMAGAVYVDGNVAMFNNARSEWDQGPLYSTNYTAEWNVFADPVAAKNIFDSEIPITLIPLDACDYVILDPGYIEKITATDNLAILARHIFEKKTGSSNEGIPVPIFDPLAAVIMADGMKNYQIHYEYLDVNIMDRMKNNQCGKTSVVEAGTRKIGIVQGVSQVQFATNFAAVINKKVRNE